MKSELPQGQALQAISTPNYGDIEGAIFFKAGETGVSSITVGQLAGPMGWYDVAIVRWSNGRPDQIHPLHMMDFIQCAEAT